MKLVISNRINQSEDKKRAPRGSFTRIPELEVKYRLAQGKIFFGYINSNAVSIDVKDFKKLAAADEETRKQYIDSNYSGNDRYLIRKLLGFYDNGMVNLPDIQQTYYLQRYGCAPGFELIKCN